MNFTTAEELMATARSAVKGKPIANNTRLFRNFRTMRENRGDDYFEVELHGNTIAPLWRDGITIFDGGGWQTVTTKARLNWLLNGMARVYQRDHVWYVESIKHFTIKKPMEFKDGMFIQYHHNEMFDNVAVKRLLYDCTDSHIDQPEWWLPFHSKQLHYIHNDVGQSNLANAYLNYLEDFENVVFDNYFRTWDAARGQKYANEVVEAVAQLHHEIRLRHEDAGTIYTLGVIE
jgi:hypothetical protein